MTYEYRLLRGRIVQKYGTMSEFANALGVAKQTISAKLTGKIGITRKDIELWSELLEIPKSDYGEYFFT